VVKASSKAAPPSLEIGWAELQEGRWEAARAFFKEAVTAEATPEVFEGLSWAAWWLDDAAEVFEAREHAYRLYKAAGDGIDAARMATWLACDELDFHGAVPIANGWLARAHRLLDPLEDGPGHGWLAFFDGYMANADGQTAKAAKLGRRSAELGRRFAVPDLEMLGLSLEGAALVATAEVEEGMRCLDEATAVALQDEADIPISGAWACCFLVSACTAVRDYERAAEWCDRIARFAERYGSRYMLAFCRAEYGEVHLWRGQWADAETMLEASVEDFSRSRPGMVAGPLVGLAELRRRQGRPEEAMKLLGEAGATASALLCRARLALDRGDSTRAAEFAERFLRQMTRDRELERASGLELLVRARTASGDLEEAGSALKELREIQRAAGTEPLRASVDVADGLLAATSGDHGRARPLFEDAIDRFERSGGPFDAALARLELATTLFALGRADAANREAAKALDRLLQLGAGGEVDRAKRLLEAAASRSGNTGPLRELTPREREVLRLITQGLTNGQIAEQLVVSEHTVHRHVTNLLRKLDLPSRTAAAAVAARAGLPEDPRA
jgi:ATP/maltotriose-dependent transcriptional regulator MalT